MTMQKRFVSWTAVSTLQEKNNQEHIDRWDGVLVETLTDPGESRSISTWEDACRKIAAYARLRDLIQMRAFDVLIFLDRSRLGRIASLSMTVAQLCHDADIILYPTESPPVSLEPQGRNFANKVVGALESVLAQEEVTKIQARHEMGMAARVKAGNFPARLPYGWRAEHLVNNVSPVQVVLVDEAAREIILRVISLYVDDGLSFRSIAKRMRDEGVPAPRGAQ